MSRGACRRVLWLILLSSGPAAAELLRLEHAGLVLNARYQPVASVAPDSGEPIYLLVHGTWAHRDMEIVRAMQEILAEYDRPSLAINLSLGVNDRQGFLECRTPIRARFDAAFAEIDAWIRALQARGWQRVVLVGHSRAGAQVSIYQRRKRNPAVAGLVLVGPMTWRAEEVAAGYDAASSTPLAQVLAEARTTGRDLIGPYRLLRCEGVSAPPQTFLSYYDGEPAPHTPDLLESLTLPVQVFLGSEDAVAIWSEREIAAARARPNVQVTMIEGADHFFRDLYLYDLIELLLGEAAP